MMRAAKSKPAPHFNPHVVRAHFVLRGTSCAAWSEAKGFGRREVWKIINGKRLGTGKLGKRIVVALRNELKKAG